jgi:IclR family transcriptional regulator, pca regulon regulatory protein
MAARRNSPTGETPAQRLDAETADSRFMLSLARGLLVLHAFERSYDLTLSSASSLTGLSRATVRRCFYTLQRLGYVTAGESGFVLLPKLLGLANLFRQSTSFAAAARRAVKGLMQITGEPCVFGMFEGREMIAVANATPANRVVSIDLDSKIPLHCSALGRMCLAALSAKQLNEYLRGAPFRKLTAKTRCTAEDLREAINEVKSQDYAFVDEELELGLRSVCVPIRNSSSQIIGGLCVVTVRQLSLLDIKRLVRHAKSFAFDLGAHMELAGAQRGGKLRVLRRRE